MKILFYLCIVAITSVYCVPTTFYTSYDENDINNETQTISEGDEAAPCLISDILYNHGQQIERQNECDYCLCVDGDMFCYWQCATKPSSSNSTISMAVSESDVTVDTTPGQVVDAQNFTLVLQDTSKMSQNSISSVAPTTSISETAAETVSNVSSGVAIASSSTTPTPVINANASVPNNQTCVVTGVEYAEGDLLPQEEGSCLQCVCGSSGRVTCSPQDCVSLQQDRYRHGLESNSLDMFDVDIF